METAALETIENGLMTKDLGLMSTLENVQVLDTLEFLKAVRKNIEKKLA